MSKGRTAERAKRRAYLQAMGWSITDVESLLGCQDAHLVDQVADLLCCSAEARRKLRECKNNFPHATIVGVS